MSEARRPVGWDAILAVSLCMCLAHLSTEGNQILIKRPDGIHLTVDCVSQIGVC